MKSHNHVNGHLAKGILTVIDGSPPLKSPKEPAVAAIVGFFFGGIGLGIYFQSLLDLVLPIVIWIVVAILAAPTGELLIVMAPVFCAIYGYRRAVSSNAKLDRTVTTVQVSAAPSAYSADGTPPIIDLVPASPPPIPTACNQVLANVSTTEAKLNNAKDLLGKGHISQSEYESMRSRILSQV